MVPPVGVNFTVALTFTLPLFSRVLAALPFALMLSLTVALALAVFENLFTVLEPASRTYGTRHLDLKCRHALLLVELDLAEGEVVARERSRSRWTGGSGRSRGLSRTGRSGRLGRSRGSGGLSRSRGSGHPVGPSPDWTSTAPGSEAFAPGAAEDGIEGYTNGRVSPRASVVSRLDPLLMTSADPGSIVCTGPAVIGQRAEERGGTRGQVGPRHGFHHRCVGAVADQVEARVEETVDNGEIRDVGRCVLGDDRIVEPERLVGGGDPEPDSVGSGTEPVNVFPVIVDEETVTLPETSRIAPPAVPEAVLPVIVALVIDSPPAARARIAAPPRSEEELPERVDAEMLWAPVCPRRLLLPEAPGYR